MKAIYLLLVIFILSCAQKISSTGAPQEEAVIYKSTHLKKKNYMTCNFFADETFRGYIYSSSKNNCAYIDITHSPKELLRNDNLFLQAYPFLIKGEEIKYGSSLAIHTIPKFKTDKVLMKSQIIDTYIIQVELDLEADQFFLDHNLELCGLDNKWHGVQFVIYERRIAQEEAVPVRITKFLKPPFLIHPEYFRDKQGSALAAYHPFLEYIPEFKSEPENYYKLEEQICSHL